MAHLLLREGDFKGPEMGRTIQFEQGAEFTNNPREKGEERKREKGGILNNVFSLQ